MKFISLKAPSLWTAVFLLVPIALLIGSTLFLKDNQIAQLLFNILVAGLSTGLGIYVSLQSAKSAKQDELTRYGLQAWRNLDSLFVKISQHNAQQASIDGPPSEDHRVLEGWLLDVDQAKWAWQDLLKEAFQLQGRLERETEEIALRFKEDMRKAKTPEDKTQIELKQKIEIKKIIEEAPLPLRVPEEINCPGCGKSLTAYLGPNKNDTSWPQCPACDLKFPIHRTEDGGIIFGGSLKKKADVTFECPKCGKSVTWGVAEEGDVVFERACPHCFTHIAFAGTAREYSTRDLGKVNAEFMCPSCSQKNDLWISPTKIVAFNKRCPRCGKYSLISGTCGSFKVEAVNGPSS